MGHPTGFLDQPRLEAAKRPVRERLQDFREVERRFETARLEIQAARCMNCGIPFCHAAGCPLHNRIPDFNDLIYRKQWRKALTVLHATNNFPEITGRICPALCEEACTLAVGHEPVSIRILELHLVERGWQEGWIQPQPSAARSGKRVGIVGSGPAGLACAQELARKGHDVVVFERDEKPGGLLRFGIPDFKLEKMVLDRRLRQMQQEGVRFETGVTAGEDLSIRYMQKTFDAVVMATGSRVPRDLNVPGRSLPGVHFALDYLVRQNRATAGLSDGEIKPSARGKDVLIVGGGDTGADCIGTARRQGAKNIVQVELLPQPPANRTADNPWPEWPAVLRTGTSHEEGCERLWSIGVKAFEGDARGVQKAKGVKLDWKTTPDGKRSFTEIPGSGFDIPAQLVLLAAGFIHPEHGKIIQDLSLRLEGRGNIATGSGFAASARGVFAAGDCADGASLVVWAVAKGRGCADAVNRYLQG